MLQNRRLTSAGRPYGQVLAPPLGSKLPVSPYLAGRQTGFSFANAALGYLSIPPGDFCLHVRHALPSNFTANSWVIFSMGASSSGPNAASNLTIGYDQNSANNGWNDCYSVVANDDQGNPLIERDNNSAHLFGFAVSNVNHGPLTGPRVTHNTTDTTVRDVFVQRSGAEISLWVVEPGQTAYKAQATTDGFGAIGPQQAFISATPFGPGQASFSSNGHTVGEVFRIAHALTAEQMEAIASGCDARTVTYFDPHAGDRYWNFSDLPAAGGSQVSLDVISGQQAVIKSAGATTAIAAAVTDFARVNISRWRSFPRIGTGANTTINLSGTYVGQDGCDIQVQVVDFTTNATIRVAWTTVAAAAIGGVWSGTLSVPVGSFWNDIQVRKVQAGTSTVVGSTTQLKKPWNVGVLVDLWGQSIMEACRYNGARANPSSLAGFSPNYSRAKGSGTPGGLSFAFPDAHQQGKSWGVGWYLQNGAYGYGETALQQTINTLVGVPCGMLLDAAESTSIASWAATPSHYLFDEAALALTETGCCHVVWNQGHGSTGDGYATYKSELATLYGKLKTAMASAGVAAWYFHILPLGNCFNTGPGSFGQFDQIRQAQLDWAAAQIAAEVGGTWGVSRHVVIAGAINDLVTSDGTHPNPSLLGQGAIGERVGATVAAIELGNLPGVTGMGAGCGPSITDLKWDGNLTVTATVAHNGGSALQTIPKAFTISSASGTAMVVSAATAGQLLPGDAVSASGYTATIVSGPVAGGAGTYVVSGASGSVTSSSAATATGTQVTGFTATDSTGAALTVASATITTATTISIVLGAAPSNGQPPRIAYQYGYPGPGISSSLSATETLAQRVICGLGQPVYDNQTPVLNPSLGLPLMPTFTGAASAYVASHT